MRTVSWADHFFFGADRQTERTYTAAHSPSRIPRQMAVMVPTTVAATVTLQQLALRPLLWAPGTGFIWSMLSEQLYRRPL